MKNLFKKLLACCLAVCMVLTLCVGAVTVSAEDVVYDGTLAIGTAEVVAGATEATVSFNALAEKDGIAAANVKVNLPTGATGISKVELETTDENVEVTFFKDATGDEPVVLPGEPEEDNGEDVLVYEGNVNIIDNVFSYILWVKSYNADVTKVAVNVKITFVGTFNEITTVTADIEACKNSVDLLNLETVPGAINVASAHKCVAGEPVKEKEVPATCTTAGSYEEVVYCTGCGEEMSRKTVTVDALGHTEVDVEAVAPTCTTTGLTAGKKCSVCGIFTVAQEEVAALGHAYEEAVTTAPTCTEEGVKTFTCANCGDTYTEAIAATGHTEIDVDAVAPTCTTTGLTAGKKCSVCGVFTVPQEEVDALGHKYEKVVTDPTCTTAGYTTYTCSVCGDTYKADDVDALGHTPGDPVEENRVEAQPGIAGFYDTVVYCTVCEAEISRTTETIPALPEEPAGPIIDDSWTLMNPSVGYGDSSLQIAFRARTTVFTKYNDVAIVIIPQKYDKDTLNYVENPEEIVIPYSTFSAGSGNYRTYYYTDILLYELGLNIEYKLRGTDASGNTVESTLKSTSAAGYLKGMTPSDDYMASLIADTLIVGQSAMENMSADYPESQLAIDAAATITAGYDLSKATAEFDMESCNKINVHNATNASFGTESSCANQVTYSCAIGAAPTLSYRIKGLRSLDASKFAFHVTYTRKASDGSDVVYDKTITVASNPEMFAGLTGNYLTFKFSGLGLQAGNVTVNCVATYDGAEVFNSQYSVETYFYNNMSNLKPGLQGLATSILKLGVSFRANANKNN